jgi:hypothetical protein
MYRDRAILSPRERFCLSVRELRERVFCTRLWRACSLGLLYILRLPRNTYLRTHLAEFRSLAGRIRILRARKLYRYGVDLGLGFQTLPTGHLVSNTRTWSRNRDTKQLFAIHPSASLVDLHLFLAGWDRGAEWAVRELSNSDSCIERQGQDA